MNSKTFLNPKQSLNKAYLKEKVSRSNIELFKKNLLEFLNGVDEKESEEHVKNNVTKFLYDTYYNGKNHINTKGRIDLAIYEDKKPVVIIEAKRPSSPDMVSVKNLNAKAMHELILYYLRERVDEGSIDIKYLVATNMYEWYVFDAAVFDKLFYQDSRLMKDYIDWKSGRKARTDTDLFYNDIAKPFLKELEEEISFTWFDLRDVEKVVRNSDPKDDNKLIPLFKLLSPAHLLKQPFTNDSNSLDTKFYSELLHIIGLEEVKDGGKKIIQRKEKRDGGSLMENAINILITEDRLRKLPAGSDFGNTEQERLFNVALELCITWINRILFLKLLEGQLLNYHAGNKSYRFLDSKTIPHYDELNKLFFQVLAKKVSERKGALKDKFSNVPYLNSSLFDISPLEDDTLRINSLDDSLKLKVASSTVLKTENGKKREGEMPTLQYLFEFLDAYDFTSEGKEEIQEENKSLINASVLGLIFEKINGYKDGSFFTPGFITMYMCRETIQRAVVQKFNDTKGWQNETFDQLYNQIKDVKEANDIINDLKICDPAVGSGHFLVSALNEVIAIKSELGVLADHNGKVLRDYAVEVVNDELIVSLGQNEFFEYKPGNKESQRVQEALFHEKQTIIENCLFGVDINPNSVKICRLRLWIELLKSAYYTPESKYTELETLPNIDINIKQGNSLVSRFPLESDLSKALKSIKYNIDDYRSFVNNYKNATDKEEKRGFEKLIEQIKGDFRTEIAKYSDPDKKKLQLLNEEIFRKYQSGQLYELKLNDKQKKDRQKLEEEINILTEKIRSKISDPIYRDAFEWRFEFPEILDRNGVFLGFDAVIGNPPYIFGGNEGISVIEKTLFKEKFITGGGKINLFTLFIEHSNRILKSSGDFSFIIPNTFLRVTSYHESRKYFVDNFKIFEIADFGTDVFDGAITTAIVLIAKKDSRSGSNSIKITKDHDTINVIEQSNLVQSNYVIATNINKDKDSIISKLKENSIPLGDICKELIFGVVITKNKDEVVSNKFIEGWKPFLEGRDIGAYYIMPIHSYLNYDPSKLHRARTAKVFETKEKLLIQRITGGNHPLKVAYDDKQYYNKESINNILLADGSGYSAKFILALLNSRLINWFYVNQFTNESKLTVNLSKEYLSQIPIKKSDIETQKPFIKIVDEILKAKTNNLAADTSTLEDEINRLVFKIYGLTEDEVMIVK